MCNTSKNYTLSKKITEIHNKLRFKKGINLNLINNNAKDLLSAFRIFDKATLHSKTISPSAQWLIDNYYILDKSFQSIKASIDNKLAKKLGNILELCQYYLEQHQYKFNVDQFYHFIKTCQETRYISIDELWAIPACLKIVLLQKATYIANDLKQRTTMLTLVRKIIYKLPKTNQSKFLKKYNKYLKNKHFIINFYYQLRDEPKNLEAFAWLQQYNPNLNELARKIEKEQADNSLCMALLVTSVRYIDELNWNKWLEQISQVDLYFMQYSEYGLLDSSSRSLLRKKIVDIAKNSSLNELEIAQKTIELLQHNKPQRELGFYLVDQGEVLLKKQCGYKKAWLEKLHEFIYKHNLFSMFSILFIITAIYEFFIFQYTYNFAILLLTLPIALELGFTLFNKICSSILPNKILLGYDLGEHIPIEYSTLVTIPCLLTNKTTIDNLVINLEINYLASTKGNLFFALLADFSDSPTPYNSQHQKLLDYTQNAIDNLNKRFQNNEYKFFLFTRDLLFNKSENCYMGWERKRGKLCEFNKFLRGATNTSFLKPKELIKNDIKYIITLDSDTILAPNSAAKLIGKLGYSLNQIKFCEKTKKWIKGYSILQPRITTLNSPLNESSIFQTIFSRNKGFDPYILGISDFYQDLYSEGTYIGKAIYDIDSFIKTTEGHIKENLILSHDLLEGSYAKCAFVSDVELLEEYPRSYLNDVNRLKRWIRGDWQLLPYICNLKKQLNTVAIIKMLDNLRRSIIAPCLVFYLIWSAYNLPINPAIITQIMMLLAACSPSIISWFFSIFSVNKNIYFTSYLSSIFTTTINLCIDNLIKIAFLCHSAFYSITSISLALYRLFISHKNLLQWQSYQSTINSKLKFVNFLNEFKYSTIFSACLLLAFYYNFIPHNFILFYASILWFCAVFIAHFLSKYNSIFAYNKLQKSEKIEFSEIGSRIWRFYETFCNAENNFLPIDNFQEYETEKIAHRTSPTNIGMYLLSNIVAYEFDWITLNKTLENIENCFNSLRKMQTYKGHYYNWYDTKTLQALEPYTISTVDSGNLAGHLIALSGALTEWLKKDSSYPEKIKILAQQAKEFAYNMNFGFLIDKNRDLLSIGFDISKQKLMPGAYDMLASEARLSYFFAIAKGDIKPQIWQKLGRFLTCLKGKAALLSWSGSMFEYLMPPLVLREHANSLLGQTNKLIIQKQKSYGKLNKKPWGISEAAFNAFDAELNYQYSNFGVPDLGLQRNLAKNYVIAPYASLMASQIMPRNALKNLRKLVKLGAYGKYGFYDAIDFTSKRLFDKPYDVIKNYYAHHHGMSLVAIYNLLKHNKMQDYFYKDPAIQAFDILLQEKVPTCVPFSNFKALNNKSTISVATENNLRILKNKDLTLPQILLLNSNDTKFVINTKTQIENIRLNPIFCINGYKIGNRDTNVIFSNNKATFQSIQYELSSELSIIATTPTEYNFNTKGYGCEIAILNNNIKEQQITVQILIPNAVNFTYFKDGFVFNSNANEQLYFPEKDALCNIKKSKNGYSLYYNILLSSKHKFHITCWYLINSTVQNLNYLSTSKAFYNETQKSWLNDQTKLFHNSITSKEASNYQEFLSILYNQGYPNLVLYIDNKNYLYSLRDILKALDFWKNRAFDYKICIVNKATIAEYKELEAEIVWLKQTYSNLSYIEYIKDELYFTLYAKHGDIGEQLIFLGLGKTNGTS